MSRALSGGKGGGFPDVVVWMRDGPLAVKRAGVSMGPWVGVVDLDRWDCVAWVTMEVVSALDDWIYDVGREVAEDR